MLRDWAAQGTAEHAARSLLGDVPLEVLPDGDVVAELGPRVVEFEEWSCTGEIRVQAHGRVRQCLTAAEAHYEGVRLPPGTVVTWYPHGGFASLVTAPIGDRSGDRFDFNVAGKLIRTSAPKGPPSRQVRSDGPRAPARHQSRSPLTNESTIPIA